MAEKERNTQSSELLGVNILIGALVLAVIAIIIAAFIIPSEAELISRGICPIERCYTMARVIVGSVVFIFLVCFLSD